MRLIPIRLRLTLFVVLATTLVFAGLGLYLYAELEAGLDVATEKELNGRADSLRALIVDAGGSAPPLIAGVFTESGENVAQILDRSGRVVAASPPVRGLTLVTSAEIERARRSPLMIDVRIPAVDERVRLLVFTIGTADRERVGLVGAALGDRDDQIAKLRRLIAIVGPLALLAVAIAAYAVAAGALRPVERLRQLAERVTPSQLGERVPVTAGRDELARLGRTLNAMLERLEQAFVREQQFVADASHELRTPLALLKTEIDLALEQPMSAADLIAALRSAGEETDRLIRLTENLLQLARSETAKEQAALHTDLPVRPLLEAAGARIEPALAAAGRALQITVTPNGLCVHGDPFQLEHAIRNLADNALRHGAGDVTLRADRDDGRVSVTVADAGPGFPPAFLPHVFERFSRADEARGRGGAGLGLALVDGVARAHGGSAFARNRSPGCEVGIAVPSAHPSAQQPLARQP